jgi:hypothetical protein
LLWDRPNRRGKPQNLLPWNEWLKWDDIHSSTRDALTAIVWRDKHDVCLLTNMHNPPTKSNFCEEHGSGINHTQLQPTYRVQMKETEWHVTCGCQPVWLDSSEQLPPAVYMWCQNDSQTVQICPCADDWFLTNKLLGLKWTSVFTGQFDPQCCTAISVPHVE